MKLRGGKGNSLRQNEGKPGAFSNQPGAGLLAKNAAGILDSQTLQAISKVSYLITSASERQHPANQMDLITAMEQAGSLFSEMAAKNLNKAVPVKHTFSPNLLAFQAANILYPADFCATLRVNLHEKCVEFEISGEEALQVALPLSHQNVEECLQAMCHSLLSYNPSPALQALLDTGYLRQLRNACLDFPKATSTGNSLANLGAILESITREAGAPVAAKYSCREGMHFLDLNGQELVLSADKDSLAEAIAHYNERCGARIPPLDFDSMANLWEYGSTSIIGGGRAYGLVIDKLPSKQTIAMYADDESACAQLLITGGKFALNIFDPMNMAFSGEASASKNELWPAVRQLLMVLLNRYDSKALGEIPFIF